ncbi:MAG: hypothetical protein V3T79_02490 [Candidatus Scalindua sediminis]|jgi:tetratricopeptide (TPR) repeat protein
MFFGIQGCTHFAKKQQDKQGLAKTKVPMDKGDNEESPLKDIKEILSLFPEFAKKWQGKQDLAKARTLMFKGDYEASLKYNKEVLRQFPRTLGDHALFQMGLNYAHPENPNPDNQKSIECFQSIIEEFPKSSIRDEAVIWILFLQRFDNLQRQKENLKDQIEKLKIIDLGIEDKKRIDLPK